MMEKQIGEITHYYGRIGVAVLELEDGLKVGDTVHISGRRTDFVQRVVSMEIEHRKMQAVSAGADVALKVDEKVYEGDKIFRVN
jgi:putative protease